MTVILLLVTTTTAADTGRTAHGQINRSGRVHTDFAGTATANILVDSTVSFDPRPLVDSEWGLARTYGDTYDLAVFWACASGENYLVDTGAGPGPCLQLTYDGIPEVCGTNVFTGKDVVVNEAEIDNGDGTVTIIIEASSADGSDLLPAGFTCGARRTKALGEVIDTCGCDVGKQSAGGPGIPGDPIDPDLGVSPFQILTAEAVIFGENNCPLLSFDLNSAGSTHTALKDRFSVSGMDNFVVTALQFEYQVAVGEFKGACCMPDGLCEPAATGQGPFTGFECTTLDGTYLGDFSTCPGPTCGPPGNDLCMTATTITDGLTSFDTAGATVDSSAPAPCNPNLTTGVWFAYTSSCDGTLTIDTCDNGAGQNTVVEVFHGPSCGTMTSAYCVDDSSGCGKCDKSSLIKTTTTLGDDYIIMVGGFGAQPVSGNLNIACVSEPTGACCLPDSTCANGLTGAECLVQGGSYLGNASTCPGPTCVEPTGGACCLGSFSCAQVDSETTCTSNGGTYLGDGTTCGLTFDVLAQSTTTHFDTCSSDFDTVVEVYDVCGGNLLAMNNDCADTATGGGADALASCYDSDPASTEADSCTCLPSTVGEHFFVKVTAAGGNAPPPGSNTSLFVLHGGPCNPLPSGACCNNGLCTDNVRQSYCEANGGSYRGDGSICAVVTCPHGAGACCLGGDCISESMTLVECMAVSNAADWHPDVTCAESCAGGCCEADGRCGLASFTQTECETAGGTFIGNQTCHPGTCAACCLPDGSCRNTSFELCFSLNPPGEMDSEGRICAELSCPLPNGASCISNVDCQNICAVDTCADPGGEGAPCDIGEDEDCMPEYVCTDGTCAPIPECTIDADCDDGLYCNGAETCASGTCQPGTPVDCADSVDCTDDSCDEGSDSCKNIVNHNSCDDGVDCTDDTCDPSSDCDNVANDANCFDGDSCTNDICDIHEGCDNPLQFGCGACCLPSGRCTHEDDLSECDDSNGIYLGLGVDCRNVECPEACCLADGSCRRRTIAECEAERGLAVGGSCADANCTPFGACCFEDDRCEDFHDLESCTEAGGDYQDDGSTCPDSGECECFLHADCNDGLYCNGVERCVALACQPGTPPDCADVHACTDDTCNEQTDQCDNTPNHSLCADNDLCTINEHCDPSQGGCVSDDVDCDDGITCTADSCDPLTGQCVNTPDDTACFDENLCTLNERCDPNLDCQFDEVNCDDGFSCTDDVCVPTTGECINAADTSRCDDSNPCTIDACAPEHPEHGPDGCVHGPKDCSDGVACTEDSCDPDTGECDNTPNNDLCLDEDGCTINERCDPVNDCQSDQKDCTDSHDCTDDTCESPGGECVHTPVHARCDDGKSCSDDTCDPNMGCLNGAVNSRCADTVDCTVDLCRPNRPEADADGCVYDPDDLLCPTTDLCVPGRCDPVDDCEYEPRECPDDGDACTREYCDSSDGECKREEFCGACCTEGDPCIDRLLESECAGPLDTFMGVGSTCDTAPCGACCDVAAGTCMDGVTDSECQAPDKLFRGPDTTCASDPCTGACCDPGFTVSGCTPGVTGPECAAIDSDTIFIGVGSSCATAPCGACCDPLNSDTGTACLGFATQEHCDAILYAYMGDQTACDPDPCKGACCLPDGSCAITSPETCPGDFRGNGTDCSELNPPCAPFNGGACCTDEDTCVDGTTPESCRDVHNGRHQGDDTRCEDVNCSLTGACCLQNGSCVQSTDAGCTDGRFQGLGTTCPDACQGACCRPDGSCTVGSRGDCGGDYRGDGTNCAELNPPCDPFTGGACCLDADTCLDGTTVETCREVHAGRHQGDDTRCADLDCALTGACCLDDGNCAQATEPGCVGGTFQGTGSICPDACSVGCTDPDCDDGRFCNGSESCSPSRGECTPGTAPCDPLDQICDELTDQCKAICTRRTGGDCAQPGDADGDSDLDLGDTRAIFEFFGQPVGPGHPAESADVNRDGLIDDTDFSYFVQNMNGPE
ncbi:MAG: hypothetical protein PVI86_02560 [Phycisphaerae bacterium]